MTIGERVGGYPIFVGALLVAVVFLPANRAIAQTDEESVGKAAAAQVLGAAPLVASADLSRYVNLVGGVIAEQSGSLYKWRFAVIRSDAINAFAMPGGYILLSAGLVRALGSEDELAFVLAHEIAHVTRKHHYQVVQRQRLAEQAARGLQNVAGSDAAKLSRASGEIYARGLDKGAEFEADRLGVEYMTRAGYDPAAALGVLERLMGLAGNDPRTELLFSTHPSPAERFDQLAGSGVEKLPRPAARAVAVRTERFLAVKKGL